MNAEGIQALLDHRGSGIDIADMVSGRESLGLLPLHWTAGGPGPLEEDYMFLEDGDIVPHAIGTIKLLLAGNLSTINVQDKQSDTALHYAVRSHALCGSKHSEIPKILFENGADAGLRGGFY